MIDPCKWGTLPIALFLVVLSVPTAPFSAMETRHAVYLMILIVKDVIITVASRLSTFEPLSE